MSALPLPCQCHHRAIRPSLAASACAGRISRPSAVQAEASCLHSSPFPAGQLRLSHSGSSRLRDVRVREQLAWAA